jgi:hypothetical protein
VNVMRERRHFYLTEGGLLFWILPAISQESRRQFQDDVLYPNNCNMFAVDEETRNLSLERSELVLRCGYIEPVREGCRLRERWHETLVSLSDLSVDLPKQRVFYFDYDKVRGEIEHAIRMIDGQDALVEFREMVLSIAKQEDALTKWHALKKKLPEELKWPLDCYGGHFFTAAAIYLSAHDGCAVGWKYELIQVAHLCADRYPFLLPLMEDAFHAFGRSDIFADKRYAEKWGKKREIVRNAPLTERGRVHLVRLRHYREAMEWLMPEIKSGITRVFSKLEHPPGGRSAR